MKVLSVPQPYASLMAAGIVDFMDVNWKPMDESSRILIYANKKKVSARSFVAHEELEVFQEVFNHIVFGNLPDFPDLPYGAIIGYISIDLINQVQDNNGYQYCWHFKDAYLFDEPIIGVKGKPRLWDYDLNEDNLPPAHKVIINNAHLEESDIYIPLNKYLWEEVKPKQLFTLEYSEDLKEQFNKKDWLPSFGLPDCIHFTHNGAKRSFFLNDFNPETEFESELGWYIETDTNGNYSSMYGEGESRDFITFIVDEEIK